MNLLAAKIALIFLVGIGTFVASLTPWIAARYLASRKALDFISCASALSAGIVLGALLCHLLPESSESYADALDVIYPPDEETGDQEKIAGFPFAGLTCGLVLAFLVSIDALIVRRGFDQVVSPHEHLENGEHTHGTDHISAAMKRLAQQQQQQQLQEFQNGGGNPSDAERIPLSLAMASKSRSPSVALPSPSSSASSAVPVLLTAAAPSSFSSSDGAVMAPGIKKRITSIELDLGSSSSLSTANDQDDSLPGGVSSPSRSHSHRHNTLAAAIHHGATGGADCEECYVSVAADSPGRASIAKKKARDESSDVVVVAPEAIGAMVGSSGGIADGCSDASDSVNGGGNTILRARKAGSAPPVDTSGGSAIAADSASGEAAHTKAQKRKLLLRAWVFFSALSLHGVFDGLSVASEQDAEGFTSTLVAVLSHKLFDGLSLGVAIFPASDHLPPYQKWLLLIVSACSTPFGIGLGIIATQLASGNDTTLRLVNAIALSLASGSFAYISLLELLPSSLADGRLIPTKLLLFIAGFLSMAGLAYVV